MDKVSSIITANRLTDSAEPLPFRPRLTSESSGVRPKKNCMMRGPAAPTRPRSNAPPIHSMKGPKTLIRPSRNQLAIRPSSLPFISIQVSMAPSEPTKNRTQCNQTLGLATFCTLLTPSSISSSMKSLVRLRPKMRARPIVAIAVKIVAPILNLGLTANPSGSNCMKPTLANTAGTAAIAERYPRNQATLAMTESSSRTIPRKPFEVAPITR